LGRSLVRSYRCGAVGSRWSPAPVGTRSNSQLRSVAKRWAATTGVVGFATVPRARSNPHAAYRAVRRMDPVHESPVGIWVLSSHRKVAAALRNPDFGSDELKADLSAIRLGPFKALAGPGMTQVLDHPEEYARQTPTGASKSLREMMLFRDPPDHTRLRSRSTKRSLQRPSAPWRAGSPIWRIDSSMGLRLKGAWSFSLTSPTGRSRHARTRRGCSSRRRDDRPG
jgi:hypothetical protein